MAEPKEESVALNKQSNGDEDILSHQVIVFRLGDEEYGLMIDQIKEVVLTPSITKVPLTPSYIKGVANIRGDILAIVDLEEKFGIILPENSQEEKKGYYSLVVESGQLNMAILVKEVPNTLSVKESEINHSPNLISQQHGEKNYIKGIIKLHDRIIILIDIYNVIDSQEVKKVIQ